MIYRIFMVVLLAGFLFGETSLPHGLTEWEAENFHLIYEQSRETDPPTAPVRNIAEFERMQGVLIRYPFGISTSIIREMAEDVIIYCLVSSSSQSSAYNSMNNAGVNMNNVEFVLGSTDSYWTRDYGPWWVVDGNREVGVVDFTYNRPRPNDNQAPSKMSNHLNVPYFATSVVHAGGNYMTDGLGIAASSTLVYEENSMSDAQVNQNMLDYYGIETYHVVQDPNNTYIDHIDCWGKYLSPHKVLIREVASSHAQYDEIEATADYFANTLTSYGELWEVVRVYTPNNQPYTNSLILNDKVLVPITGSSWDDDALAVYQEAMPGYEVLGFTGSWESTDALHCRAKGIPDLGMLQIFHNPLNDTDQSQSSYSVNCIIDDLSEAGLIDNELAIFWRVSGNENWTESPLESQDCLDCYGGFINYTGSSADLEYFIQASDNSGRTEQLPFAGYYSFSVAGGNPCDGWILMDLNNDLIINVIDVVQTVNIIIGQMEPTECQFWAADNNSDGVVNVLDIVTLVNTIIGN